MGTLTRLPQLDLARRVTNDHGFYTTAEASRIARVPQWTVNAWRREGVVVPSVEWTSEEGKSESGYTFETLVFLRLIRMLREQRISLLHAVEAVDSLRKRFGPPGVNWADARLFTQNGRVFACKQDEWQTTMAPSHQKVFETLLFEEEFAGLKDRLDSLLVPKEFAKFVEIDPSIRNGLPIVINTTIPTNVIHNLRQQRYRYEQIHAMYPFITRRTIIGADKYEDFLDSPMSKVA